VVRPHVRPEPRIDDRPGVVEHDVVDARLDPAVESRAAEARSRDRERVRPAGPFRRVVATLGRRVEVAERHGRRAGLPGLPLGSAKLDLAKIATLTFEAPDLERFPALRLAREAVEKGGIFPPTLNAANEIAVAAFLKGSLKFLDIAAVTEQVLDRVGRRNGPAMLSSLDEAVAADADARRYAAEAVAARAAA